MMPFYKKPGDWVAVGDEEMSEKAPTFLQRLMKPFQVLQGDYMPYAGHAKTLNRLCWGLLLAYPIILFPAIILAMMSYEVGPIILMTLPLPVLGLVLSFFRDRIHAGHRDMWKKLNELPTKSSEDSGVATSAYVGQGSAQQVSSTVNIKII